jgi:chromosomal replication initiator protein
VLAYSSFHGRAIALDLAKEALKDVIGSARNVGIDNIQKTVADYYKIKVADFSPRSGPGAIARPRQVAMWLCREVTSHSFRKLAMLWRSRPHDRHSRGQDHRHLRSKENELNHDLHVLLQVLKG